MKDIILESSYADADDLSKPSLEQVVANYISDLFQNNTILERKAEALKNAINQTLDKYDHNQVYSALDKYINTENADNITNAGNAIKDLKYFVRPDDVQDMLIFINNQDRHEYPASYYIFTKNQNLNYQLSLYMMNLTDKRKELSDNIKMSN